MVAVGHERGAADLLPHADPKDGDALVPQEADDGRRDHRPQVLHGPGMQEAIHGLVSGDNRAEQKEKRLVGLKRAKRKAIQSGTAVAASPKLWIVSARSATLPEKRTTTTWKRAVASSPTKDHLIAEIPRCVERIVGSIIPWVWPWPRPWRW